MCTVQAHKQKNGFKTVPKVNGWGIQLWRGGTDLSLQTLTMISAMVVLWPGCGNCRRFVDDDNV